MAGRSDGAIFRLIYPSKNGEAEAELNDLLKELLPQMSQFIPDE